MKALGLLGIGLLLSFNASAEYGDFLFKGQEFEIVDGIRSTSTSSGGEQGQTCTPQADRCGYQTLSRQVCNNAFPPSCITETYQEYACVPQADSCTSWGSATITTSFAYLKAGVNFLNPEFEMEVPFEYEPNQLISVLPKSVPDGHVIGVSEKRLSKEEKEKIGVDEYYSVKFFRLSEVRSDKALGIKNVTIKPSSLSMKIAFTLPKDLDRNEEIELIVKRSISQGAFKKPYKTEMSFKGTLNKWDAIITRKKDGSIAIELPAVKHQLSFDGVKSTTLMIRHTPSKHEGLTLFGEKDLLVSESSAPVKILK